jgi:hypothetical protein
METTDNQQGRLAKAESEIKAMVRRCTCGEGYRVKGLEYDTGGCLRYKDALAVARKASEMGGTEEWARRYAITLDGSPKWSRRRI